MGVDGRGCGRGGRAWGLGTLLAAVWLALGSGVAEASGPRWVTGPPYFTGQAGVPVAWGYWLPPFYTDPGDLSQYVNHAAADAMVTAAAMVWNVPTAGFTISYGGTLAEHVSAANTYLGPNGPVFPADVQSTNLSKPIAVIYDSDGSVTEMLLGAGSSAPGECRQNGVTESVDNISASGLIQHAVLVVNGRCTGPAPEQQLQLQYQLERAFGRAIGLGWSQTNDNVFTQTPTPTYNQAMHWPIMHPIDILCGPYTYQCVPQPFTLRDDDVASISEMYSMVAMYSFPATVPLPGKQWSYVQASRMYGTVNFPTGEGMQGVNVLLQRQQGGWATAEPWYDVSAVSGALYQSSGANPVVAAGSSMAASMGSTDPSLQGYYIMGWVPDIDPAGSNNGAMSGVVTVEAINPLYTGSHAVGPYVSGSVSPSGAVVNVPLGVALQQMLYPWSPVQANLGPTGAASHCSTSGDGVESAPAAVPGSGWWTGVLCARGHAAWSSVAMRAGRTATVEVTSQDEQGLATTAKAMPLVGVWKAGDATGSSPTVAMTASSFNTLSVGTTAVGITSAAAGSYRFVVADARGDGRPDFGYQARVLYADTVQPAATSLSGGLITINGTGFRAGNQVTVNGVQALVASWTPTTILAVAPPVTAFHSAPSGAVDVAVTDVATGGTTVMSGVVTYGTVAADVMTLVSAPSGTVGIGQAAATAFAVKVTLADGATPVVGLPVAFSASGAAVQLGGCAGSPCMAVTDGTGVASVAVTPTVSGAVTLQASAVGSVVTASFNAMSRSVTALRAVEYVAAGTSVAWTPQVSVVQDGEPAAGIAVSWTGTVGLGVGMAASSAATTGVAQATVTVGPLAAGSSAAGQACAWGGAVCAEVLAVGVDPAVWRVQVVSGAGQTIGHGATFSPVMVMVTDGAGHSVAGAPVAVHQTVDAAAMACPATGRCAVAPVLGAADSTAVSDQDGMVSVVPMQMVGVSEVTNVAIASGTQGFVSFSIAQGN